MQKATDGHSPYIADGTNGDKGYWYFWDDKANDGKGGFVKGDKAQATAAKSRKDKWQVSLY
mgnify:CR=1 FL=1